MLGIKQYLYTYPLIEKDVKEFWSDKDLPYLETIIPNFVKRLKTLHLTEYQHDNPVGTFSSLHYKELIKVFTIEEIQIFSLCYAYSCRIKETFGDYESIFFLPRKIYQSLWQTETEVSYLQIAKIYNGIRRFKFIDKSTIYIDYTNRYLINGYSCLTDYYLDGSIAFNIEYKDSCVCTISFLPAQEEIFIRQIQLRGKGNRWLYKIGNLTSYVIERFKEAFPGQQLYLITAESLTKSILKSYGTFVSEEWLAKFNLEVVPRLKKTYFIEGAEKYELNRNLYYIIK